MRNFPKTILAMLLGLFYLSANAELKSCEDEVIDNDNLKVTFPKIDIPAVAYSDEMTVIFSRRRCTSLPYYSYDLIATVTPTESGKSILEAYELFAVQENSVQYMVIPLPYDLTETESFNAGYSTTAPIYEPLAHLFIDISKAFTLEMRCTQAFIDYCTARTLKFEDFSPSTQSPAASVISNISGTWYDPAYSGSGFNISEADNGLVATFYGYKADADGQAQWLLSNTGPTEITKGESFTLELYQPTVGNGANFTTKPNSGSGISAWGTVTLTFNSCSTGTAVLNGADGNVTHNLVKLSNVKGATCTE